MRHLSLRAWAWGSLLLLLACSRWEPFGIPTTPAPALPSYVRVSTPGRASTLLVEPFVRRDTLYGLSRGDTLGIACHAIERLERPRLDGLRTLGAVVGGLAGWITLGLLGGGLE